MTAPEMVGHLIASTVWSLEPNVDCVGRGPMAHFPVNWLVIHLLPWPQGKVQAPPELLRPPGASWDADLAELRSAVQRFGEQPPDWIWPQSPVFGRLTGPGWGALLAKHMDHHLRQFGV